MRTLRGFLSRTEQLWSYSGLLSCATPDYFPVLLRSTFPHYSGLHSHATPVHTPVLLQSTTGLDQTPLDLLFNQTCAQLDMGSSWHSSVTYVPISCHLYLLVPSLFPAHIYFHLPISTSVIFASHWQWLSLGTYCPLSSFCEFHWSYILLQAVLHEASTCTLGQVKWCHQWCHCGAEHTRRF